MKIASLGDAFDQQGFVDGLMAIDVPTLAEAGSVRAALAVHAPVSRFLQAKALARLPLLQSAASRLKTCFTGGKGQGRHQRVAGTGAGREALAALRSLGQRFLYKWNWARDEKF